jgi:DNA-binding response OmpR family regulator
MTATPTRHGAPAPQLSAAAAARANTGTRILIVDDDPDLLDMLMGYFLTAKFEVDTATDGAQAVAAVSRQRPDIVLLDIQMPRMSGLDALREIMRLDDSIAVIMVTGTSQLTLTIDAIRSGAFGYVPKPFDFRYLDHLIAAGLSRPRHRR